MKTLLISKAHANYDVLRALDEQKKAYDEEYDSSYCFDTAER